MRAAIDLLKWFGAARKAQRLVSMHDGSASAWKAHITTNASRWICWPVGYHGHLTYIRLPAGGLTEPSLISVKLFYPERQYVGRSLKNDARLLADPIGFALRGENNTL